MQMDDEKPRVEANKNKMYVPTAIAYKEAIIFCLAILDTNGVQPQVRCRKTPKKFEN